MEICCTFANYFNPLQIFETCNNVPENLINNERSNQIFSVFVLQKKNKINQNRNTYTPC
jgi:hypothetical protein